MNTSGIEYDDTVVNYCRVEAFTSINRTVYGVLLAQRRFGENPCKDVMMNYLPMLEDDEKIIYGPVLVIVKTDTI